MEGQTQTDSREIHQQTGRQMNKHINEYM